jgi:8-oxo-dGTP pyrophosphatase MutT (NUDIX family)
VENECTVDWPAAVCTIKYCDNAAPGIPVTSVHCFCFKQERLLVIQHESRGIDIPGGHIEEGENPLEALRRELNEEAAVEATNFIEAGSILVKQLFQQILLYICTLFKEQPFNIEYETRGRLYIAPEDLPELHKGWNPVLSNALQAAQKKYSQLSKKI